MQKSRLSIVGILSIIAFFYFSFDLALHTYDFKGKVIRLGLALLVLAIPLLIKARREGFGEDEDEP